MIPGYYFVKFNKWDEWTIAYNDGSKDYSWSVCGSEDGCKNSSVYKVGEKIEMPKK